MCCRWAAQQQQQQQQQQPSIVQRSTCLQAVMHICGCTTAAYSPQQPGNVIVMLSKLLLCTYAVYMYSSLLHNCALCLVNLLPCLLLLPYAGVPGPAGWCSVRAEGAPRGPRQRPGGGPGHGTRRGGAQPKHGGAAQGKMGIGCCWVCGDSHCKVSTHWCEAVSPSVGSCFG
jgi:hypothetical protein